MNMPFIRPLAICVFSHESKILVSEEHDPSKSETFYRPLGGGIEFGEHSLQTICRELKEEIGAYENTRRQPQAPRIFHIVAD